MDFDKIRLREGEQLLEWARGLRVRTVEVLDGSVFLGSDPDDKVALYVELVVSAPPPGETGWMRDDIAELRRLVWAKGTELEIQHWYLRIRRRDARTHAERAAAAGR